MIHSIVTLTVAAAAVAASPVVPTEPPEPATDCNALIQSLVFEAAPDETNVVMLRWVIAFANDPVIREVGRVTVLLPTRDAIEALPKAVAAAIAVDEEVLESLLEYHVIIGESLGVAMLVAHGEITAINGSTLTLELSSDAVVVNGGEASVVCADLQVVGVTVHLIDAVLLPADGEPDIGGRGHTHSRGGAPFSSRGWP
ncbi:MAG: fasciclin domain-containing protein [Acidimicrobiales bacterium]